MRDLLLVLTLAAMCVAAFRFPYIGLYAWEWLTIMNPHRLAYGFAFQFPLNLIVAVLTIIAWVITPKTPFKIRPFGVMLIIFSLWISITTLLAPDASVTTPLWDRNIKTMVLTFMVIALCTTRERLTGLLAILCVSLSYYGIKGGIFMIFTGGNNIVYGPPATMIEDNNCLALALVMTAPLLNFLRTQFSNRYVQYGIVGTLLLLLASVLGSYSRGGLIALFAMLGFLWIKSRAKFATLALAVVMVVGVVAIMPDKYMERISTIGSAAESDDSFKGRLEAWEVAWKSAFDYPFGAGFDGPRQWNVWSRYLPDALPRASHSIYFMVLGEHGFIGFFIYAALCAAAWLNLSKVEKLTRDNPSLLWAGDLAKMLQVSMLGFFVGGAALPMAYYDGFFTLLGTCPALLNIVDRALQTSQRAASTTTGPDQAKLNLPAAAAS